jgi:putative intracellular protease/amidase
MNARPPQIARLAVAVLLVTGAATHVSHAVGAPTASSSYSSKIPAWASAQGHRQPIVAIAAENSGTELTDFAIPYGVFKRAGIETVAVSAHEGPVRFRPALRAEVDSTMAEFDARHPEGADYVVVPAMVNFKDAALAAWLRAQAQKGATIVSICDGAVPVAYAGLLKGKWATAHWASESNRRQLFPTTQWVKNTRYVADGRIISSAGISAAMPTSVALVEAMLGIERAQAVAYEMGLADWSPRHNSDAFGPQWGNLTAFAVKLGVNPYLRGTEKVGVPLTPGMDEINLAIAADAYSRTGRSQAYAVAPTKDPVSTRYGLRFLPDEIGGRTSVDVMLPPLAYTAPGKVFDTTLAALAERYGERTAYGVALDFEYPGYAP